MFEALIEDPRVIGILTLPFMRFVLTAATLAWLSSPLLIAFLMVSRLPVFSGKTVRMRVPPEMVLPLFVCVIFFIALLIGPHMIRRLTLRQIGQTVRDDGPGIPEEVRPHIFLGVPRVWEKFYSAIMIALKDATPLEKKAYETAIGIGYRMGVDALSMSLIAPGSSRTTASTTSSAAGSPPDSTKSPSESSSVARWRAAALSPIARMASPGGPIHAIPAITCAQRSSRLAQSRRYGSIDGPAQFAQLPR